jgi:2-aminoethylphosphonate-pyruvate transaminase
MTRLLFNPGPTNTSASTKRALLTEDMSHRTPAFTHALDDVCHNVVHLLHGADSHSAILFSSSGTGANEAVLSTVAGPVMVIVTGRYSERLAQIAERWGHDVRRYKVATFAPVDAADVGQALDGQPDVATLAFVHHETTTGLLTPLRDLCAVAGERNIVTAVDAISSVGAHVIDLADHGPDWMTVTANKGWEGIPGVSLVIARTTLLQSGALHSRSFYFDIERQWRGQQSHSVPFTLPVQVICALREALDRARQETPAGRARRYALMADLMRTGLADRGFRLIDLPPGQQSNVVIPVHLPDGLDYGRVRDELEALNIEVYSASEALAQGYFFVAAMGALSLADITQFLDALQAVCLRQHVTLAGESVAAR